jgi:hypothetical protein
MGQPLLNPRLGTPAMNGRLATPACKNSASTSYGVSLANRLLSPMVAIHHCIVHVPKTQFLLNAERNVCILRALFSSGTRHEAARPTWIDMAGVKDEECSHQLVGPC